MSDEECYRFNIEQKDHPEDPLPYVHIRCNCGFHFIPLENAWDKTCPKCKTSEKRDGANLALLSS